MIATVFMMVDRIISCDKSRMLKAQENLANGNVLLKGNRNLHRGLERASIA